MNGLKLPPSGIPKLIQPVRAHRNISNISYEGGDNATVTDNSFDTSVNATTVSLTTTIPSTTRTSQNDNDNDNNNRERKKRNDKKSTERTRSRPCNPTCCLLPCWETTEPTATPTKAPGAPPSSRPRPAAHGAFPTTTRTPSRRFPPTTPHSTPGAPLWSPTPLPRSWWSASPSASGADRSPSNTTTNRWSQGARRSTGSDSRSASTAHRRRAKRPATPPLSRSGKPTARAAE
mmetsp:Transcript_23871/g.52791  ORF Transcript_23871/g.52791 Transcript_23871/m.52791 type:complete len:233 (+) Transcript_23871:2-700(+)